MDRLCRSCMCECTEVKNLFDVKTAVGDQSYLIADMFMACASVEITQSDALPNIICGQCELKLSAAFEFKQQCEETDNSLRKLVSESIHKESKIKPDVNDHYDYIGDGCVSNLEELNIDESDKESLHCRFCLKGFQSMNTWKLHMQEHDNDRLRSCHICQEKVCKSNLLKHLQSAHKADTECTTYTCEKCNICFTEPHVLCKHMGKYRSPIDLESENSKANSIDASEYLKHKCPEIDIQDGEEKGRHECTCCNKVFTTFAGLKVHKRRHTGYSLHPCAVCKKAFTKSYHLKRHMLMHAGALKVKKFSERNEKNKKMMQCEFCPSQFKYKKSFSQHMGTEHEISGNSNAPLSTLIEKKNEIMVEEEGKASVQTVEECNEGPTNDVPASIDPITDNELANSTNCYTCHVCQATFVRSNYFTRHMIFHKSALTHKCGMCDKAFATPECLAKHTQEDHDKPYTCTLCDRIYSRVEHLIRHLKTHLNPTEIDIKCSMCEKGFTRSDQLARHTKVHLQEDKRYVCSECGKAFNRVDNLKAHHERIHTGQKNNSRLHLCIYCGKGFNSSSNMIVHMRRHTGERPYKCDQCGKRFLRSYDLTCHERTHSGEKPYLCTLCGKAFNKSNKLLRHTRVHTGERPYACNLCSRAFTQSNDLAVHMRRHTGARPYVCGICPAKFIHSTQLKTHRRSTGHWMETQPDLKGDNLVEPVVPLTETGRIKFKIYGKKKTEEELNEQPQDVQSGNDVANSLPEKIVIEESKLSISYQQLSDIVMYNINSESADELSDRAKGEV